MLINASANSACSCLCREKAPLLSPGFLDSSVFVTQGKHRPLLSPPPPCPSAMGLPGELLEWEFGGAGLQHGAFLGVLPVAHV